MGNVGGRTCAAGSGTQIQDERQEKGGVSLALFGRLIEESGHQDRALVQDLANGFSLTGEVPKSGVFKNHLRPAKILCDNLRKVAKIGIRSLS